MTMESNTGLNVSNNYGTRDTGGSTGSQVTNDSQRIYVIDLDGDAPLEQVYSVLNAGTALEVIFEGTAGDAAITINSVNVTAATYAVPVAFTAGELEFTNTTGTGKVKVITMLNEA